MVTAQRRGLTLLAAAALATSLLGGCGDDEPGADGPRGTDPATPAWTASSDPLDSTGLIWASGSTVHLADGTTVDTGRTIASYVVAGDAVYFTTDRLVDDEVAAIDATPLYAVGRSGPAHEVAAGVATPLASPDGRYLVFLDVVSSDRQDRFGTTQVQTVVVDLDEGVATASADQMGDLDSDDFADLYNEAEIRVLRVTDETAYVRTAEGDYAIDLASGESAELDPTDRSWDRRAGDPTSPDGQWQITDTKNLRDLLVSEDGTTVTPQTGTARWDLDHWTADGLAVGFTISGPGSGGHIDDADRFALMGCTVPAGTCRTVAETTGRTIRFPAGQAAYDSTTLPDGS